MLRDKEVFNKPIYIDSVLRVEVDSRNNTNIIKKENRTNWVVSDVNEEINIEKAYRDFETLSLVKATGFVYDDAMIRYLDNTIC